MASARARETDQEQPAPADAPVITHASAPADELTKRFLENRKGIVVKLAPLGALYKVVSVYDIPTIITSGIVSPQSDDPPGAFRTYSRKGVISKYGSDKPDAAYRMYYINLGVAVDCADPVFDDTNGIVDWYSEDRAGVKLLQQVVW